MAQQFSKVTLSLTDSVTTTGVLHYGNFSYGRIINRSGGAVTLTVHECDTHNGEYVLCDDVGTAGVLAAIADNESLDIPAALAGSLFLKFVAASGTPSVVFTLKG